MYKRNITILIIVIVIITLGIVIWNLQKQERIIPLFVGNNKGANLNTKGENEIPLSYDNCSSDSLKRMSDDIDKTVFFGGKLKENESLRRLVDCYKQKNALRSDLASLYSSGGEIGDFYEIYLLDINNDRVEEIILTRKLGGLNNLKEVSILKKEEGIYREVEFSYIQNNIDRRVYYSEIIRLDDQGFNDYDRDGVFESFEALESFYVFQDGAYVRVNETRDRKIDCYRDRFPECIWLNTPYAVSSDRKKVAWSLPDIYSDGGGGVIVVYDYNTEEFEDYYSGEKVAYGSLMDYLEWTIGGDGVIFIQKACAIPGCSYEIRKLDIVSGKVANYESIYDSSFESNDDISDNEVIERAKKFVTQEMK